MSIPSDSSRNINCPSQAFRTRMVMIPSISRPSNIFPINCPQSEINNRLNAPMSYQIVRYNSPAQYQQISSPHGTNTNLHGNENNTNVKAKNLLPVRDSENAQLRSTEEGRNEDPLDLSSTNLSNFSSSSKTSSTSRDTELNCEATTSSECIVLISPKKEPITPPSSQSESKQTEKEAEQETSKVQRKRKSSVQADECLIHERELEGWVGHVKPVPGIPRQAGSKREEVLKAARSLFSKRTRTLYHWLYPSTSKNKLKATVAAAWDTLSTPEKDFYISQVLGRFGVPAGSLMVNPQLGGFKGLAGGSSSVTSSDNASWTSYPREQAQEISTRKRRRQTKNMNSESSSARQHQHQDDEETLILKQIREESLGDDFANDPELSKEFEQFKWALHVSHSQEN